MKEHNNVHELIDIGINLVHESFEADRSDVIASARTAGVSRLIITGTSITTSAQAVELSLSQPGSLYATAGIHPHHATEFDSHSVAALTRLLTSQQVVAVGECGLDYFRNYSSREDQQRAFDGQLQLAAASGLPVFLHQRDAHDDMLALLDQYLDQLAGGVAHCFTGNREQMQAYLDRGLYIGITGWICDERRGDALREAVTALPLDRLLVETDGPYLLPRDLKPSPANRRNEPRFLPHIVERIAALTGHSTAAIAAAATANAVRLFRLS